LFAWDRLYPSGTNVVDATLDLFVPSAFDALFAGLFIEACDQTMDEQAAILG